MVLLITGAEELPRSPVRVPWVRVPGEGVVIMAVLCAVGCADKGITLGPGLARATSAAGGKEASSFGPTIGVRMGAGAGTGVMASADLQPFRVQNPVRDEAHRILFAMPMLALGNRDLYVAGGLGLGFFYFTGKDCICGLDAGLALGGSIGLPSIDLRGRRLSAELLWRGAVTSDFELDGSIVGIQLGWPIASGLRPATEARHRSPAKAVEGL